MSGFTVLLFITLCTVTLFPMQLRDVVAPFSAANTKRDMRFGICDVNSLYRAGSHTAAARELTTYKLDLVGVQVGQRRYGKSRGS